MTSLQSPWNILAHPLTVLVVGVLALIFVFAIRKSLSNRGDILKVFGTAMATYIFSVLAVAQIGFSASPSISELISLGIGEARFANLLMAFIALGLFDLMQILFDTKRHSVDYTRVEFVKLQQDLKVKTENEISVLDNLNQARSVVAGLEKELAKEKDFKSIDKIRAKLMVTYERKINKFVYTGLSLIMALVLIDGVPFFDKYFNIDPSVLAAIVGGTAAAIVGLLGIVAAGLFGPQKK